MIIKHAIWKPREYGTVDYGLEYISDCEWTTFDDFVTELEKLSHRVLNDKWDNQLMTPAVFNEGIHPKWNENGVWHKKEFVDKAYSLILDYDDTGKLGYESIHEKFPSLSHVIYSTANATSEVVKLRAVIELDETTSREDYSLLAHYFHDIMGRPFDKSKLHAQAGFNLPSQLASTTFRYFKHFQGEPLPTRALIDRKKAIDEKRKHLEALRLRLDPPKTYSKSSLPSPAKIETMISFIPLGDGTQTDWGIVAGCLRANYSTDGYVLFSQWSRTNDTTTDRRKSSQERIDDQWSCAEKMELTHIGRLINLAKSHGYSK
jgi:hypothetical protein